MPANIVADARPAARLFLNRTRCPDAHDEIAKRSPRSPPGGVKTEGLSDIQSSINFRGTATQPGRMLWGSAEPIELPSAIMTLASLASRYITRHASAVDGGCEGGSQKGEGMRKEKK